MEEVSVKKGDYLIKEGEESTELFALLSGELEIIKVQDEHERTLGHMFPGELVGEMSFLDKKPRSASVRASKDSSLLVVPRDRYEDVFSSQPDWYQKVVETLLDRLRSANERSWV